IRIATVLTLLSILPSKNCASSTYSQNFPSSQCNILPSYLILKYKNSTCYKFYPGLFHLNGGCADEAQCDSSVYTDILLSHSFQYFVFYFFCFKAVYWVFGIKL